jgi:hypothetical protein
MIMNAQPSQYGISGDTNTRARSRSPLLELYTRTAFGEAKQKINSELLPPAAADCAWGVRLMKRESKREDEKLSTEAGQLQLSIPGGDWMASATATLCCRYFL